MHGNINISDSVRKFDPDGRLRVSSSNISKETINPYYGYEIPNYEGLGLDADKIYKLYRPGNELEKAAPTFNGIQIVSVHKPVSADEPQKELVIGATGTHAIFEAPYLKNSLSFWDSEAIGSIEAADKNLGGAKELSCGYAFEAVMSPGEFEGDSYDGMMTNIVGNHLALVERGRAGSDVKVSDINIFEERTMRKNKIKSKAAEKVKAMDIEISPEQLDSLIDTVIGVSDQEESNTSETNPEPEIMDEEEGTEESAKKMLKAKGLTDEEINKICGMFKSKDRAMDEEKEESKEEKNEKAEDEEGKKEEMKKEVNKAMDSLEKRLRTEFKELEEAKHSVRSIVGDVLNVNSAEDVYRFALDHLQIEHKGINEIAALKALIKIKTQQKSHAFDSSNYQNNIEPMLTKIPSLAKIKIV